LYRIAAQMRAFLRRRQPRAGGAPLAILGVFMKHPSFPLLLALVGIIAINTAMVVRASGEDEPFPHIRPTDARLRALINDAARASVTVRALIDRITASDVVVLLACDRDPIRSPARLNFMTAAGGVRYVLIRLKNPQVRHIAISLLAHELQHAVEIADTPAIVNEESMAREYARMGGRRRTNGSAITFDTASAVDIGRRVLDEISGTASAD
jgi:hypothetical protein